MGRDDTVQREVLPIPGRSYAGLVTYDAKDPDTEFPPTPTAERLAAEGLKYTRFRVAMTRQ